MSEMSDEKEESGEAMVTPEEEVKKAVGEDEKDLKKDEAKAEKVEEKVKEPEKAEEKAEDVKEEPKEETTSAKEEEHVSDKVDVLFTTRDVLLAAFFPRSVFWGEIGAWAF